RERRSGVLTVGVGELVLGAAAPGAGVRPDKQNTVKRGAEPPLAGRKSRNRPASIRQKRKCGYSTRRPTINYSPNPACAEVP
ncbi:MAG: hypothetical protein V3V97_12840, partial [Hyphomicrobiaceae bacterium]